MSSTPAGKLVLKCDQEGRILQAEVCGDFLLDASLRVARLALCVDRASAAKCERFLQRVRTGAAFGWELHMQTRSGLRALLFAGLCLPDDTLWVAAAESSAALLLLLDECLPRSDRAWLVPHALPGPPRAGAPHFSSLDELTRVNNELVGLHRELAKRNAELVAITEQRNELLAVAAHDLRSPLLVVQGYCDMLGLSDGLTQAAQRELVENVQRASDLMLSVLQDTLEYARLESGQAAPHRARVDAARVVQQCAEGYRSIAQPKQIELCVRCDARLPMLQVDPTHLAQIVGNLLSNAIKYSDPGSKVEVTLSRHADHLWLAILNSGQGIPAEEVPLLFRPFQTTSTRPTGGETSTGLGLAIVRKLVEANGGEVTVSSALHEGATFTVKFPLAAPQARGSTGALVPPEVRKRPARIHRGPS